MTDSINSLPMSHWTNSLTYHVYQCYCECVLGLQTEKEHVEWLETNLFDDRQKPYEKYMEIYGHNSKGRLCKKQIEGWFEGMYIEIDDFVGQGALKSALMKTIDWDLLYEKLLRWYEIHLDGVQAEKENNDSEN